MNEEVNYCSQCGVKISPEAKFCSSCGHDLKNSSTKITLDHKITLDKAIKLEVTNATVEKGFEAVGKVFKRNKKKREEKERQKREEKIRRELKYKQIEATLKRGTNRLTIVYIIAILLITIWLANR